MSCSSLCPAWSNLCQGCSKKPGLLGPTSDPQHILSQVCFHPHRESSPKVWEKPLRGVPETKGRPNFWNLFMYPAAEFMVQRVSLEHQFVLFWRFCWADTPSYWRKGLKQALHPTWAMNKELSFHLINTFIHCLFFFFNYSKWGRKSPITVYSLCSQAHI